MIEAHSPAYSRMSREQTIMHCLMILSELDRVSRLIDVAIIRCEEAKMLDAYGEG